MSTTRTPSWCFLTASRNDGEQLEVFLKELLDVLLACGSLAASRLYVVDDYSLDDTRARVEDWSRNHPDLDVRLICVPTNLGNQGAIAFALRNCEVPENAHLITLDSDGEDDLQRIPQLLQLSEENREMVVFTERGRRHDGLHVRVLYRLFRGFFTVLTGSRIMPNNFMVVPGKYVEAIRLAPFTAVYYALAVLRLRLPHVCVRCDRRPRYGGSSSQSLYNLTSHAFVGLMMFYKTVISKLFLFLLVSIGFFMLTTAFALFVKFVREASLPGWTAMFLAVNFGFAVFLVSMLLLLAAFAFMFKIVGYRILASEWDRRERSQEDHG
ncbi:MAG: glycosyltransferase [bacterium]|nr:glycosyltransferase [bacterium]